MSKDNALVRLEIVERQLAELMTLPTIMAASADAEADRRRIESAEREAAIVAEKKAAETANLKRFLDEDPLVRVEVIGGVGSFYTCPLSFPTAKITSGRLALMAEGTPAINGTTYYPTGWTGRSSDWRAVVLAGGAELERAVRDGRLAVTIYESTAVIGDPRLRRAWFASAPKASAAQ